MPDFLKDLLLESALSSYCQNVNNYILQSNKNEHVVDIEGLGMSYFVTDKIGQEEDANKKYFEVINKSEKDFALLQIDNAIIKTNATQKCDCAIVDESNLCFIEFKANATSIKPNKVKKNYCKAMKQLGTTISIFKSSISSQGKDLKRLRKLEAYVCFRHGYPRKTSSEMNY
jgi:hypothetical protein